MTTTYEQMRLAMDGLEALCSQGAFLGACACLGELEAGLAAYMQLPSLHPEPLDPTNEALGALLVRLRAAVERRDFAQVCSTSSDLRGVLASQRRAHEQAP